MLIGHLLWARRHPELFHRLTDWFSEQLDEGGALITPTSPVRKAKQGWATENPVSWAAPCPPTFVCWSPNPHPVLKNEAIFGDRVFKQVHRIK